MMMGCFDFIMFFIFAFPTREYPPMVDIPIEIAYRGCGMVCLVLLIDKMLWGNSKGYHMVKYFPAQVKYIQFLMGMQQNQSKKSHSPRSRSMKKEMQ